MMTTLRTCLGIFAVSACIAVPGIAAAADKGSGEVNVYSYRQPFLVKPLFDAFTEQSGVKVNVVFAKKGLLKRLEAEGRNSPADLVFTVDIARLTEVVKAGLGQPVKSAVLDKAVPAAYRHPDGLWYGLTSRARIIYASKERVPKGTITSYEQLADPKWKGRICTRKGDHPYNVALLAAIIGHHGEAAAEKWLEGVRANLARKPQGNDRAQVKAIMEGVCDLSIGNHYYMAKMLTNEKQKKWADSAYLVFPKFEKGGVHLNVSGVMMTKHAPNSANALKLMEFLASGKGQKLYAEKNFEYPIDPSIEPAKLVASWGKFKGDGMPLAEIADNRPAALKMINKVGFNEGPMTN